MGCRLGGKFEGIALLEGIAEMLGPGVGLLVGPEEGIAEIEGEIVGIGVREVGEAVTVGVCVGIVGAIVVVGVTD